jgi:hypothetical protein
MRNFRQLRSALAIALVAGALMAASGPTLQAAGPSDKSLATRCALLARAIASTTASLGADSPVVAQLQAEYDQYCTGQ